MKKAILWILGILIISQLAYAGITNPLPTELNLYKGESGRFKFQVQTVASNQELECTPSLEGDSPLEIEFDEEVVIAPAGSVRDVYATVSVPNDVGFGTYEENFCLACKPTEGAAGADPERDRDSSHQDLLPQPARSTQTPGHGDQGPRTANSGPEAGGRGERGRSPRDKARA